MEKVEVGGICSFPLEAKSASRDSSGNAKTVRR